MYFPITSNADDALSLFKLNATPATPSLMASNSFGWVNPVQDIRFTSSSSNIILSYKDTVTGLFYRILLDKSTLALNSNTTISAVSKGLYIQPQNYILMNSDN